MIVSENGEKKTQKILEGIQYLIGDNKHLREEMREFARRADEDRKRADEGRRRSDQRFDRMIERMDQDRARADEERARSDDRFAALLDQVKRTNRVAVNIARDIRRELRLLLNGSHDLQAGQKQMLEGQKQTNQLLGEVIKRLPHSNGK